MVSFGARAHTLSWYTPLCLSCGLVLCVLNLPQYACPFPTCASILLAPPARAALRTRLGTRLEALKAHETQLPLRAEEDARRVPHVE